MLIDFPFINVNFSIYIRIFCAIVRVFRDWKILIEGSNFKLISETRNIDSPIAKGDNNPQV